MQDPVFTFIEKNPDLLLPESFLKEWAALAKKAEPAKRGTDLVLQVLTAKQRRLSRRKIKKLFERGMIKNHVFKNLYPVSIGQIVPTGKNGDKHVMNMVFSYEVGQPT